MRKFINIMGKVFGEILGDAEYFFSVNLRYFASIINFLCPYVSMLVAINVYQTRGYFAIGGEVFIPIIFLVVVKLLNGFADQIGKGNSVPIPEKRFTDISPDGEVNIEHKRLEELILYTADLEDYLERKGLL